MSAITNASNRWQPRLQPPPSPAGQGDALLAVPTIADLIALDSTLIDDGGEVSVKSLLVAWILDKTSVAATDGITVVAANPVGRWFRTDNVAQLWLNQPTWHINPGTGADENFGTTGPTALATHAELMRRIGGRIPTATVTVYIDADMTEPIVANWGNPGTGIPVTYLGALTVLFSGAMTGGRSYDPPLSRDGQLTDASLPASWTASGLVGKRVFMTSGASSGYAGWIIKDLGAKTARYSPLWLTAAFDIGNPSVNDTYDVCDGTKVNFLCNVGSPIYAKNLDLVGPGIRFGMVLDVAGDMVELESCLVDPVDPVGGGYLWMAGSGGESYMYSCRLAPGAYMFLNSYLLMLEACALETEIDLGDSTGNIEARFCVSQFTSAGAYADVSVNDAEILGWHAIFDNPAGTDANYMSSVQRGQYRGTTKIGGLLWGTGNAANYGVRVSPGMTAIYDPALLPTVGPNVVKDVIVGTLTGAYADLPISDMSKMAGMVPK